MLDVASQLLITTSVSCECRAVFSVSHLQNFIQKNWDTEILGNKFRPHKLKPSQQSSAKARKTLLVNRVFFHLRPSNFRPPSLTDPPPPSSLQSAEPYCVKSPTFRPPPRVQPGPRLSSRAEDPAPCAASSLLEPRWRPAESITPRCHSCCLWPLCCYRRCSPAPSPYVSVSTPGDLGGLTFISAVWKKLQGSRRMES